MAGAAAGSAPARSEMTDGQTLAVALDGVSHRYGATMALDAVGLILPAGQSLALIGPDGVGKSTLLGLIAGARKCQSGSITVLDGNMRDARHRRRASAAIAYMPQGLGRNLYMDLTVAENLAFFARLFGKTAAARDARTRRLLQATGLAAFTDRLAGQLSGGMKQKLGLCCALLHDPDLLVLDEPTTGVDPLSRQQFWQLLDALRASRPEMSLLVATAYMEEAERFDKVLALNAGATVAQGSPAQIREETATASLEAAFVTLTAGAASAAAMQSGRQAPFVPRAAEPAIQADGLTRRFGTFTAVDSVSFRIEQGEIFGFLGSNGCGKTTTMKMLTGLLPPSAGQARVFGQDMAAAGSAARRQVGYMSQSFSLYGELTVFQNLTLHARLFHLPPERVAARVALLLERCGLAAQRDTLAADLPLGVKQRLSLAVAVAHAPSLLILDEPTSGVDPLARDAFWSLLQQLSREDGVTIFVSTHFMNEALRCDRISLMHAGRVLATGAPQALMREHGADSLDRVFIDLLTAADPEAAQPRAFGPDVPPAPARSRPARGFDPGRLLALSLRESRELLRDPIRLAFALFGTAILMVVFGFGITFDVEDLRYAVLDWDQSLESRSYLEGLAGSPYFQAEPPLTSGVDLDRRLKSGAIVLAVEIPPGFGKALMQGRQPEVAAWIDGSVPFRAETVNGYLGALHRQAMDSMGPPSLDPPRFAVESRYRYNQDFKSVYAMVPAVIAIMLVFIPAVVTALGVVREKELGSIANLYATPLTRLEFLLGKQLPYVFLAFVSFLMTLVLAVGLFGVPVKGSLLALAIAAVLYAFATTGLGLFISTLTRTQIAALFAAAIGTSLPAVLFSGMMQPVSTLEGGAALIGELYPTGYFMQVSIGVFTKGLGLAEVTADLLALALFFPALTALSWLLLRKQER